MALRQKDLDDAERLARNLLAGAGISRPPVPDDLVSTVTAREIHFVVKPGPKMIRGRTDFIEDEWWVWLNGNDSPLVRRFTLWHEAYHIAVTGGLVDCEEGHHETYECALANHFASHVLVPREWLRTLPATTPRTVAHTCRISTAAAERAIRATAFELRGSA